MCLNDETVVDYQMTLQVFCVDIPLITPPSEAGLWLFRCRLLPPPLLLTSAHTNTQDISAPLPFSAHFSKHQSLSDSGWFFLLRAKSIILFPRGPAGFRGYYCFTQTKTQAAALDMHLPDMATV